MYHAFVWLQARKQKTITCNAISGLDIEKHKTISDKGLQKTDSYLKSCSKMIVCALTAHTTCLYSNNIIDMCVIFLI